MACFEQLLLDTTALLVTPWGMSEFRMDSGIKQGAVESPCFFSLLMEEGLCEASELYRWADQPHIFPDMVHESALFMDDGILWGCSPAIVGVRLEQLLDVLKGYGSRYTRALLQHLRLQQDGGPFRVEQPPNRRMPWGTSPPTGMSPQKTWPGRCVMTTTPPPS